MEIFETIGVVLQALVFVLLLNLGLLRIHLCAVDDFWWARTKAGQIITCFLSFLAWILSSVAVIAWQNVLATTDLACASLGFAVCKYAMYAIGAIIIFFGIISFLMLATQGNWEGAKYSILWSVYLGYIEILIIQCGCRLAESQSLPVVKFVIAFVIAAIAYIVSVIEQPPKAKVFKED